MITFTLSRTAGDPVAIYTDPQMSAEQIEKIRDMYHFNDPIYVQYFYYLQGIFRGDLGYSVIMGIPVSEVIIRLFPATIELAMYSWSLAFVVGVILGTKSAVGKDKVIDHSSRVIAITGYSMPTFWLGLVLLFIFYFWFGILGPGRLDNLIYHTHFPPLGSFRTYTGLYTIDAILNLDWIVFFDAVKHLILPVVILAWGNLAIITRIMRSSMLEVLGKEFIKTAKAKGLSDKSVINEHARKNALIPTITAAGLSFAFLLSGVVMIEEIFNWPGLGSWAARSAISLDHAGILGFVLLVGAIYSFSNLVVDVLYVYLDPRIRLN